VIPFLTDQPFDRLDQRQGVQAIFASSLVAPACISVPANPTSFAIPFSAITCHCAPNPPMMVILHCDHPYRLAARLPQQGR
jgi:hypothetical protein